MQLRLYSGQDIDLHQFDFLDNRKSFEIIEDVISRKNKIPLCDVLDSRNEGVNEATKRLKRIHRNDNYIFQERGAKDLYIGWPFVEGKFIDGTPVRCPLLFFPVSLEHDEKKWYLQLRKDVNITFNKSFVLAYGHFNETKTNDDFIEKTFDHFDGDSQVFRNELYQFLKDSPLEINFNQELFSDKLLPFDEYKKIKFEQYFKTGVIKLVPKGVLGIYPQAGSYLVPDYEKMLDRGEYASIEDFFLDRSTENPLEHSFESQNSFRFLNEVREDHTFTPFKADASQENAIKAVKKGNSLVVQGPPGTGKSQLICNLISDFIARGQRVLVVCQKKAALDVVYKRMKEKDVGDFIALVHDFKNDRKHIYDQLNNQIEKLEEYQHKNNQLDTIYLERDFAQYSRKIDQLIEEFEEFKFNLFDETECGYSAKELYLTSDPKKQSINLKLEYRYFTREGKKNYLEKLQRFLPYLLKFERTEHPWKDRVNFKNFGIQDMKEIKALLKEIPEYQEEFKENTKATIGDPVNLEEAEWILDRKEVLSDLLDVISDPTIYSYFQHMLKYKPDKNWFLIRENVIMDCFKRSGIESSIPVEELGKFQEALEKCIKARKRYDKWLRWWFFSKDKYLIKKAIVANNLNWSKAGFKLLIKKIDNRLNVEHNISQLMECEWLKEMPATLDVNVLNKWFHEQSVALEALTLSEELRSFREYLKIDTTPYENLCEKVSKVLKYCKKVVKQKRKWEQFLTDNQIEKIVNDYEVAQRLSESLDKDFDALVEFDRLKETFYKNELEVTDKLIDASPKKTFEALSDLLNNSIKLHWVDHIETKYPVLRSVSSMRLQQNELELQEAIRERIKLCKDILLLKVREQTYRNVEYNRLRNMVTYRDLKHQVTKKRKIWPLRKTIANHAEEIFDLIPCWMASPESVSAIFPMEKYFDLVIFDEASQCFAEKGIPSMYRGKQVVVTGDEKQLSPNELYQIRWEDEEEDSLETEVDSLLDLSSKFLMQVHLRGHYRSKSLDLIDFSNQHFYNNKLRLLPDHKDINEKDPAINYVKIDGLWENGANQLEAEKVVEITQKLLEDGKKDIGIVTFNFRQQNLIQDLLEEKSIEKKFIIPYSVFIKNIENVQGDERDIIIFSVGYAPDTRGRLNMQFGSLNMEKGENRLNVAVTRAREKIFMVSSIMPQQLKVEDTKHDGPKLFKKYLEYAFNVSEGRYTPTPYTEDHATKWYLKNKLPELLKGFDDTKELKPELPFADLTLKQKEGYYEALFLTDDDLYFQSISAKDAHAYVPLSLKQKKWKFERVYSRTYWVEREKLQEELITFVNKNAAI